LNSLEVTCYSGRLYADRPQSFRWQDVEYEIREIEKEWLEPGERYFRVRTGDNKLCQLCYNEKKAKWSIIELAGD